MKNDNWIMVYKTEPKENNMEEFSSKGEFIQDVTDYCLCDSFEDEYDYEENEDQIIIKIKKDG